MSGAQVDAGHVTADAAGTPCREIPVSQWHDALAAARQEGFDYFDWLTAVDQTDVTGEDAVAGLDVVCHLMATSSVPLGEGRELRHTLLRTRVPEGTAVGSVTDLFRGAAWHERETHEMFGLDFTGFDDGTGQGLRPLLLPHGFEGTPLRKSFVLAARASKPWPGAKEPGEGEHSRRAPSRRKLLPPGVPDPEWGPR
ncbi:MAG TPA: NADH-quinone oxidoreductase subunit C [Segeticoccus sp.]|uniref:NADH-quinone oxidoreductase subunit C n=1 Tax=Segeticoccus sp. TaxID=2706531 RepID=UPI002D7F49B7|nr:NADH-quinone oxidoreductase subunit C [Segeticoccus sp.]HET8599837.1 NADH-quinone oxidoreductase subunit C [Segeticoccus sp.]